MQIFFFFEKMIASSFAFWVHCKMKEFAGYLRYPTDLRASLKKKLMRIGLLITHAYIYTRMKFEK